MLAPNPQGGYSFLTGIAPCSAGVVADGDLEIERARLARPLPFPEAFARVDAHLTALGRPPQALFGMELRSPGPFTFESFNAFNADYVRFLRDRNILVNGVNPVARTNVAPDVATPSEPVVYAFSYTVPARNARRSFIVVGACELPEGSLDPHAIVRRGEDSPEALAEKARFVLGLMGARLRGLGVAWDEVSAVDVYTVHNIAPFLTSLILPRTADARHGIVWHYTRPPIAAPAA